MEKHGREAREEILNASSPTDEVTHQEDQDEDQPKSKKKGRDSYIFTDAQEVDLSEWYKDHELFYNKLKTSGHTAEAVPTGRKSSVLTPTVYW